MKHTHIVLFAAFFSPALNCMEEGIELQPFYTRNKVTTTIATTDTDTDRALGFIRALRAIKDTINGAYPQKNGFFSTVQLSEEQMIDVTTIASRYCTDQHTTKNIFEVLHSDHDTIKNTIDFFTEKATLNMRGVTSATIATIENPTLQQPERSLNRLSPLIKQFIMQRALQKVTHSYTLSFTSDDEIICFDIGSTAGYVVTVDKNNTTQVWNINTNTCCATYTHDTNCHRICLNTNGTHLATAHKYKGNYTLIKQWKINNNTLELTHAHLIYQLIGHISYCNNNTLIAVGVGKQTHNYNTLCNQLILQFADNGHVNEQGATSLLFGPGSKISYPGSSDAKVYGIGLYKASIKETAPFSENYDRILTVTKKSCAALYLCEQAINNSLPTKTLRKHIEQSQSFQSLTPYEKQVVQEKIQEKLLEGVRNGKPFSFEC